MRQAKALGRYPKGQQLSTKAGQLQHGCVLRCKALRKRPAHRSSPSGDYSRSCGRHVVVQRVHLWSYPNSPPVDLTADPVSPCTIPRPWPTAHEDSKVPDARGQACRLHAMCGLTPAAMSSKPPNAQLQGRPADLQTCQSRTILDHTTHQPGVTGMLATLESARRNTPSDHQERRPQYTWELRWPGAWAEACPSASPAGHWGPGVRSKPGF